MKALLKFISAGCPRIMLLLAFNLIANLMYGQEQWEKEGEIKDLEIEMTKNVS